jgi:hypothetical protein
VDEQGNVYFNGGRGLGKIDPQGKLTYVGNRTGGHWLCLDADGSFSRSQPKYFERVTPDGAKRALIFADGGSPIAVLRDGLLYYASGDETMTPGGLRTTRQSPSGEISIFPLEPVMHFVEKKSVHCKYIWPLPFGWRMYEKHIRVTSAMKSGRFA